MLHLVNLETVSKCDRETFIKTCFASLEEHDTVVLMNCDCCYPLLEQQSNSIHALYYILAPQQNAVPPPSSLVAINYAQFVEICTQHSNICSWY